jgi:uncharacterized protein DUF4838
MGAPPSLWLAVRLSRTRFRARALVALVVTAAGILTGGGGASAATARLVLVGAGGPRAAIVVWNQFDSPVADFAAHELRRYIHQMTGVRLPVVPGRLAAGSATRVTTAIVVRTGPAAEPILEGRAHSARVTRAELAAARSQVIQLPRDAFAAQTVGSDVVLEGNGDRGTLYAVYWLLGRFGVRFFAPRFSFYEPYAEQVPVRSRLLLAAPSYRSGPDYTLRRQYIEGGFSLTRATIMKLTDWMAKHRLNVLGYPYNLQGKGFVRWDRWGPRLLPALQSRGIMLEVGQHGYQSFLPTSVYGIDHPDWFVPGYNVFDIANQDAVTQYVDNVVSYLRAHPEISIFDAWPPDGAQWAPQTIEHFGSIANAESYLTAQLRAAADTAVPGVTIEALAYGSTLSPPDPSYPYDARDVVDVAVYDRSYREPVSGSGEPSNRAYVAIIRNWRAAFGGSVGVFEYYRKYRWHSLPVEIPGLIGVEIPFYRSIGVTGLGFASEAADWIPYELNHLMVPDMEWDSGLDPAAYVRRYLSQRFGPASSAARAYLAAVEDAGKTLWPNPDGAYDDLQAVTRARDDYLTAEQALADMRSLAPKGSAAAFLAERLGWNLDYAVHDTESSYWDLSGDPDQAAAERSLAQEQMMLHRLDGVMLDCPYARNRYAPGSHMPLSAYYRLYRSAW